MKTNPSAIVAILFMAASPCLGQRLIQRDVQKFERPAPGEALTLSEKIQTGWPTRWGNFRMYHPQGSSFKIKGPVEMTEQFDLAPYRTPLASKIVSRRWFGNEGMYLANEQFYSGPAFWNNLVRAGYPVANSPQLEWVMIREGYWYSRYMLSYVSAQSRMGIHMVHGPYWHLKADEFYHRNRIIRDRGERVPSVKDVLLGVYAPIYNKRTGWPRIFEDANPTMLDYKSGDPHLTARLPLTDTFDDPMSNKVYGWGVPAYLFDWRSTRWDHDTIDTTINIGTVAQTMKKKVAWTRFFFKSPHDGPAYGEPKRTVVQLGGTADEGFRGIALLLSSLNTMLEIKASLIADERGHLGGVNPFAYDPSCGLRYIPHEIKPNLIFVGDLPIRPNAYDPLDLSSQLWDQASLLWATTDYYEQCFRFQKTPDVPVGVFSVDPPADGGLIEQRTYRVALGLSNLIVKNLEAMHFRDGVLASKWTPCCGAGGTVSMRDSSMVIVALGDYIHRMKSHGRDPYPELRKMAQTMAESQAAFLLGVQEPDGSFYECYSIPDGAGLGKNTLMRDQFFGIRALCAAYHLTGDERYLRGAKRAWNLLNTYYWDEATGLYRSDLASDVAVYTPLELAAAYSGIREMILASPAHRARPILMRYLRFWVQSLDNSGMQMAEDFNTGEVSFGLLSADHDSDGIPFITASDGKYGVAPIPAGVVAINLGEPGNPGFQAICGQLHVACTQVGATYEPDFDSSSVVLPESEPVDDTYVKRETMERWEALPLRLAASKPIKIGSNLSGEEIFRRNCMVCHGQRGEGIFGFPLTKDMFEFPKDAIINTVTKGRFDKMMPTWGEGFDELNLVETDQELIFGNVLTEGEIERVVDYLKTGLAEKYKQTETFEAYMQSQESGVEGIRAASRTR